MTSRHGPAGRAGRASEPGDDDDQVRAELFARYHATRERSLRDELVLRHRWIADSCARRFAHRGEPLADLQQVGLIGVVKAVERFDPHRGHRFESYAMPTVMGELRRHFRDTTWRVAVPRRSKDQIARLNATVETLSQELGRPPRPDEVAAAMDLDLDATLEVMEASHCYRTSSLDEPGGDAPGRSTGRDRVGAPDQGLADAELRLTTVAAVEHLDERSRRIILWRYYEGCTQAEIGQRLGIGQVQVSRLLRAALGRLRGVLDTPVA